MVINTADCKTCKEQRAKKSNQYDIDVVAMMAMAVNRRLVIIIALLIVLLVGSNCAWLWYNSQFEDVESTEITQEVDTGEGDAIVTGIGDINYGESPANG